jgi:hypothetical protein
MAWPSAVSSGTLGSRMAARALGGGPGEALRGGGDGVASWRPGGVGDGAMEGIL